MKRLLLSLAIAITAAAALPAQTASTPPDTPVSTKVYIGKQKNNATHHRIADKKFWFTVLGQSLALALDIESSHRCMAANTCRLASPLFGATPSRAKLYSIGFAGEGGVDFFVYRIKRDDMLQDAAGHHDRIPRWYWWANAWTAAQTGVGIYNFRLPTHLPGQTQ